MDDSLQSVINIKRRNLKSVINYLREVPCATKKEISQDLSLSFATVSNLCNWMEAQGIFESRPDLSQGKAGRSPKRIRLQPRSRLLAAVDIHKSNRVIMRLYNLLGQVESHAEFAYKERDIHDFVDRFAGEYRAAFTAEERARVDGIGVAASGIYDTETERLVAQRLDLFEQQPLKQMLSHALGLPVYIENDSNLSAFGLAKKMKTDNLIYLYIGEGLGIGIVANGKHTKGQRGYAPEICHAPFGRLDRRCQLCGSDRCMETDLSIYGFGEKFTGKTPIPDDHTDWELFANAFAGGDKRAAAIARENAEILAFGASIAVNLFDPEVVAIGGVPAPLLDLLSSVTHSVANMRRVVKNGPSIQSVPDSDFKETLLYGIAEMAYARWCPSLYPQAQEAT